MTPHKCPVCDGSGKRKRKECPACIGYCVLWEKDDVPVRVEPQPVFVPSPFYVQPWWVYPTFTTGTGTTDISLGATTTNVDADNDITCTVPEGWSVA